jgi:hypothetical protein
MAVTSVAAKTIPEGFLSRLRRMSGDCIGPARSSGVKSLHLRGRNRRYSLIGGGMNWWEAILTIFAGNAIVVIPMILNAHAGTAYGIPFPVF